jgi:hypothetical protein
MTTRPLHNYAPEKFPLTIRIKSGKTDAVIWSRTITLEEARGPALVKIPGYAGTEHYPVRAEVDCADGTSAHDDARRLT